MTDKKIIQDLLPANALGCLSIEDTLNFKSVIDENPDFPWEELGEYQLTASLIPLTLNIESPSPKLKDKIALRLIKLRDEEKAKLEEEKLKQEAFEAEQREKERIALEEAEQRERERVALEEAEQREKERIAFEEAEALRKAEEEANQIKEEQAVLPETQSEPVEVSSLIEQEPEKRSKSSEGNDIIAREEKRVYLQDPFFDSGKKSMFEKMLRSLEVDLQELKSKYEDTEKKLTRYIFIAFISIAILLALIIFMLFKFTSDINVLREEIKDLKDQKSSQIIFKQDKHLI